MGAGSRGGWYSYDGLDNGRRPSALRIVPELQHPVVGTIFPALPGVTEGFTLLAIEHERMLSLGWLTSDGTPDVTWTFLLNEVAPDVTRLPVRVRGRTRLSIPQFAVAVDQSHHPGRALHHAAKTTAWHYAPREVDAGYCRNRSTLIRRVMGSGIRSFDTLDAPQAPERPAFSKAAFVVTTTRTPSVNCRIRSSPSLASFYLFTIGSTTQ